MESRKSQRTRDAANVRIRRIQEQNLDLSRARRANQDQRRVNVDFPVWMIHSLDREARRLGVARQSLIKLWISERLQPKT